MKSKTTTEYEARYEAAYQRAMEITDQSWLDSGMSPEELAHSKVMAERFLHLLDEGLSFEEAESRLNIDFASPVSSEQR